MPAVFAASWFQAEAQAGAAVVRTRDDRQGGGSKYGGPGSRPRTSCADAQPLTAFASASLSMQ